MRSQREMVQAAEHARAGHDMGGPLRRHPATRPDRLDELHVKAERWQRMRPNELRGFAAEARSLAADASDLAILLQARARDLETDGKEPF